MGECGSCRALPEPSVGLGEPKVFCSAVGTEMKICHEHVCHRYPNCRQGSDVHFSAKEGMCLCDISVFFASPVASLNILMEG